MKIGLYGNPGSIVMAVLGKAYLNLDLDLDLLPEACSACPYSQDPCRLSGDSWPLAAPLVASYEGLPGLPLAEGVRLSRGRADPGHSRHLGADCFHTLARILLHHSHRPDGTRSVLHSLVPWQDVPPTQRTAAVGIRCIHLRMPL